MSIYKYRYHSEAKRAGRKKVKNMTAGGQVIQDIELLVLDIAI